MMMIPNMHKVRVPTTLKDARRGFNDDSEDENRKALPYQKGV